jgi:hypothetical protein
MVSLALAGCGAPQWKQPVPVDEVDFMAHAQTQTDGDVTVTVAVPDRDETTALFGTSLYNDQIQPVWIGVDNQSDAQYVLMIAGVDSNAYSPLEAAYQRHSGSKEKKLEMDRFFYSMGFRNPIRAGQSKSGFVFTDRDEGYKAVNIDLLGDEDLKTFSFVVKVRGIVTDMDQVDFDNLYESWTDMKDMDQLRQILSSLPCCTTNKRGDKPGDPLNIVLIGDPADIFSALIRSGWHQTEITHGASAWKTVKSFAFGTRYRYSPISPLYVFGRPQDLGLQKARSSIHLRNHMRLWRTRYNYRGMHVYLGQISRDIGVKFNKRTITTHAIDPDVDDTRNNLIGDLAYSQSLASFGFVKGSQLSTLEDTHYNLTPDPYFSDGFRAVMIFDRQPRTLEQIDFLDWEKARLDEAPGNP